MKEYFDKDYFYGNNKSNYIDYDSIDPNKHFKNTIGFIKTHKIKGRYLDIGCAFGLLIKEVSPFFDEVYGCDISQLAIQKSKQNAPKAKLKIVDLEKSLPYPNNFFDCITVLDILEHTKSFEKNFEKIVPKLKKGGYLIISVPIDAWPRRIFGFMDKDKTHTSILKEKEILEIVRKNKLQMISRKHFGFLPVLYKTRGIPAEVELVLRKA